MDADRRGGLFAAFADADDDAFSILGGGAARGR